MWPEIIPSGYTLAKEKEKTVAVAPAVPEAASPSGAAVWAPLVAPLLAACGRFIDKFGVSFSILIGLILVIWKMGNESTQNDFIRQLLFADVTHTSYLQVGVAILIIDAVFGVRLQRWMVGKERAEIKRLAEEKAKLQEALLKRSLAHTADHVNNEAMEDVVKE